MTQEWKMQAVGLSSDRRTNVWRITPPCGHKPFTPQTTMFSMQEVICPKCGIRAMAYYNDDKIVDLQEQTSD
jgi:hypothetical protein